MPTKPQSANPFPSAAPTGEALPEPAWDIARLFPPQGHWTQDDFLKLETSRLIEFVDGAVEVLEMPTPPHQQILRTIFRLFDQFIAQHQLGQILFAPTPLLLWPGRIREPDLLFIASQHEAWIGPTHCEGADLVVEVLSTDRQHDLVTKRADYAQAGIPEYWIVDPQESRVTVLRLVDGSYVDHGHWGPGGVATSSLLKGFAVKVDAVFAV